jgi:phage/plasmid-associated DNA primase
MDCLPSTSPLSIVRNNCKKTNGATYDIVTQNPKTNWVLTNPEGFFTEWCKQIKESNFETPTIVYQKASENVPLIIDFSMIFGSSKEKNPIDSDFLPMLIKCVQKSIICLYEDDEEILNCCVLDHDKIHEIKTEEVSGIKITYSWKIRLFFPNLKINVENISKIVYKKLPEEINKLNIMKYLDGGAPENFIGNIKAFTGDLIPMYGTSEKKEQVLYYNCSYPDIRNEDLDDVETIDLDQIFDVNRHSLVQTEIVNPEMFGNLNHDNLLPFYLTTNYKAAYIQPIKENETPIKIDDDITNRFEAIDENEPDSSDFSHAKELVKMLANERFTKRIFSINIGKGLHNASEGGPEGLKLWTDLIRKNCNHDKTPNYIENNDVAGTCEELYNNFDYDDIITVKTIAHYARIDSSVRYENWHRSVGIQYIKRALYGTNYAVAKAFCWQYWLDYACSNVEKKTVYHFKKSRWNRINGCYKIRIELSENFKRTFELLRVKLSQRAFDSKGEDKTQIEKDIKKISALITKLETRPYKASVTGEILDLIFIDKFDEKLDSNGNVTGHPNGVTEVDYTLGTIEFRQGMPEDYIYRITAVPYNKDLTFDHPKVKALMGWVSQMFMDEDLKINFLKLLASGFVAGNLEKILPILTGDKHNSKSTMVKLIARTWGMYAIKVPISLLTFGYGESGKANPDIARLSGSRWAFADEPEYGSKINSGSTKRVTGNDDIPGRSLYQETTDMKSTATVIVSANGMMGVDNPDMAIKDRLFPMPCLTTYLAVKDAPTDPEEQIRRRIFPRDPNFINTVERYRDALLWVSYQYFSLYATEGITKTESVTTFLDEYWEGNDRYIAYRKERLSDAGENSSVTVSVMYKDFERWHKANFSNEKVPDRTVFRRNFTDRIGPLQSGNCWNKIKLIETESNVNDMTSSLSNKHRKIKTPGRSVSGMVLEKVGRISEINEKPIAQDTMVGELLTV